MISDIKHIQKEIPSAKKYFFVSLLLAVLGMSVWVYTKQIQDKDTAAVISSKLDKLDKTMKMDLENSYNIPKAELFQHFLALKDQKEFSCFVFEEEKLVAWTDYSIGNIESIKSMQENRDVLLLDNGYFLVRHQHNNGLDFYALSLIKSNFAYENDYLQNSFASWFNISTNPTISFEKLDNSLPIKMDDKVFFYINEIPDKHDKKVWSYIGLILFLLSSLFLTKGLGLFFKIRNKDPLWIPVVLAVIVLVRVLFYQLQIALEFDDLNIFNPELYASSKWFPSLGDYFITSLFIFFAAQFVWRWIVHQAEKLTKQRLIFTSIILFALFFTYAFIVNSLFRGLVEDSSISFNINNFFKLSPYSLLGIIIVGLMLFSAYYLSLSTYYLLRKITPNKTKNLLIIGAISVYIAGMLLTNIVDWMMILWPVALLIFTNIFDQENRNQLTVRIILLSVLTIYASYMFEKYSEIKSKKALVILADKLAINNDVIAENLYTDIEKNMTEDVFLRDALGELNESTNPMSGKLIDHYFKGYWNRYDINLYLFDSLGTAIFSSNNLANKTMSSLNESIMEASYSTPEGLHMVNPEDRHLSYLSHIPVQDSVFNKDYELFLEFDYKFVKEELGFPELLIKGSTYNADYADYSVARYVDNRLISQKGSFPYLIDKAQETGNVQDSLYSKNGYLHYSIERSPHAHVISIAEDTWLNKITDFTYLYSIFDLMFIIFVLIERIESGSWQSNFSLQVKIQALVISIVLISLMFYGLGSYYYIVAQNKAKNENLLREKVSSVLIELSHKLEKENAMDDDEKIAIYLEKFSNVFFTDINVYALDGNLRASSRPQLFDQGIVSGRMNPEAYYSLAYEKNSRYTHNEKIGNLSYLSSYVPFYGSNNEVLAYLNLPYFAKQAELEQELSAFVVAIINMLVLLFILSAFGALFVSRLITSPLQTIQENLTGISLERTNSPITYSGKDEIGTLVNAYNNKLDELREKAEELAQSERETAWREMAKQVAHEIKNPLTPMKLSIQYLQKAWADESDDWEERFNRSTATLIEQIDTLSGIASAFGDFAKMPKAQSEKIDLRMILDQVISLFSENDAGVNLDFICDLTGPQYIIADKDQMTRVFNNLIKNAIQSIPQDEEGHINVRIQLKGHQYIVEVADNGTGISEDKIDKIFVPNFTTKSTGTGLGLAMVKSIVENAGGKVWFNTVVDKGTSFYVSLNQAGQ